MTITRSFFYFNKNLSINNNSIVYQSPFLKNKNEIGSLPKVEDYSIFLWHNIIMGFTNHK